MKIAYIGDFINHGSSLKTPGTSLIILLSRMENVASIDVYCPKLNKITEKFQTPENVKIINFYMYNHPLSIMKLLHIPWNNYDFVIFNMLPTGYGTSSISNAIALLIPLILTKVLRMNNIRIIYHNSVFTNDVKALGYNSIFNRIRAYLLGKVEKTLFKNVKTFVILNLYKERIDKAIGKNLVQMMDTRYLDAITTVYMNNVINERTYNIVNSKIPIVLLHGFWGPQKNIELALYSLSQLRKNGIKFKLIISGGINSHFLDYENKFKEYLDLYSDVIDEYLGLLKEKDIMGIFLQADLAILPYNTPGGHSGVLDQTMFFDVPTIAFDFPEYREQARENPLVNFTKPEDLYRVLMLSFKHLKKNEIIEIQKKVLFVQNNIKLILEERIKGDN